MARYSSSNSKQPGLDPSARLKGWEGRPVQPIAGDSRLPLYQRLRDDLMAKIESGTWRYGLPLPSEAALAASYGVSLGTMRHAIEMLVKEGVLERRQGRGTFLRRPDFNYTFFRLFQCQSADGSLRPPESRILSRKRTTAPVNVAAQLQLKPGAPTIYMTRLRLFEGEPLATEEIWLPEHLFASFLEVPLTDIEPLMYSEYERICGQQVVSAEEVLFIDKASSRFANFLNVDAGVPVVVIERLAYGRGGIRLEWRRTFGRADRFRYRIEIR